MLTIKQDSDDEFFSSSLCVDAFLATESGVHCVYVRPDAFIRIRPERQAAKPAGSQINRYNYNQ